MTPETHYTELQVDVTGGGEHETMATDAPRPLRDAGAPPNVAGYTVLKMVGRGGMGVVWEAVEHRLDRRVALKVQALAKDTPRVAQMWSEARLAAKVSDPGVVPVHDVGMTLDGDPFFTMEFVEGTDLRALLREGALPVSRALELSAQIASAVGAAHERGIVHRDLKPGNVLVDSSGRARVLDFGLAYDWSLGDDMANPAAGTPAYMAPEQITREAVGPPADVHAIGVMLYEMLTGVRPWNGGDEYHALLRCIVSEPPIPPSQRNPNVSASVEALCLQCLAKAPEERFPSARALAVAIDALRLGRSFSPVARTTARLLDAAPRSLAPSSREPSPQTASVHRRWSFQLRSSADALWPYVSNTDRLNRAIGQSSVEYTDTRADGGASTRSGSFRLFGMEVEWREYPFEWVAGRAHSVFRRYRKGPVDAVWNSVQLLTTDGGGTELVHEIWVMPKGIVGRIATFVELDQKTGKNLRTVYERIDQCILDGKGEDPFEPVCKPSSSQRRGVERAITRLTQRGFDPPLVTQLVEYVLVEPVKRLERMRPFELADAWGVDRPGMLDFLMHAADAGLLELSWDAVCPRCRIAHETFKALCHVAPVSTCVACGTSYERDLADSVEIVFRPHPSLRDATPSTYCAGAPALRPHVIVQQRLIAGERRTVEVTLTPGSYKVLVDWPSQSSELFASGAGFLSECEAVVNDGKVEVDPQVVRVGAVRLTLSNPSDHEQVVRLEREGARDDTVTAAMVMTHPSFRELFSDELLSEVEPIAVRRLSFLSIDVAERALLFAERGDAGAWTALKRLDGIIDAALHEHRGVLVPAPLGIYGVAFISTDDALLAALAVQAAWQTLSLPAPLRASIHEGPCIAATRGDRVEYFGKTVHRTVALLDDAPPGGVVLSDAAAIDRDGAMRIRKRGLSSEVTKSVGGPYAGMRITKLHA